MHAVVYEVEHKQGVSQADADAELDMMVEGTKSDPAFVSGLWLSDGTTAYAIVVVDSEETARSWAADAAIPPEATVALRSARAFEVQRQA